MKSFVVAICAPSGTGKTTVARALLRRSDDLLFSVSVTTRAPRPREREGVDYRFVDREEFERMIREGELLEWATVHDDLYGTPRANLEEAESGGKLLLLDIDVQGARQLAESKHETVTILLLPPSFDVLLKRLRSRASENDERLRRRLETARGELETIDFFDYVVVNDYVRETVRRVRAIMTAERHRRNRQDPEVRELCRRLREGLEKALE
jgi:guanylate kinase